MERDFGFARTLTAVIIGHAVIFSPVAMALSFYRCRQLNPEIENAARELGATELRIMVEIVGRQAPQLDLRPEDFNDFASRVLDSAIVARRNECKTTCSEFLANINGKKNGILYRVHGDKKGIFAVTFAYLPERESYISLFPRIEIG